MARRIVFARSSGFFGKAEEKLYVDQWIAIDWKHKIFVDNWSGEIGQKRPSFEVGLSSQNLQTGAESIIGFGLIEDSDEIAWLKGATHGSYMIGGTSVNAVTDVLARVHQLSVVRDGIKGFLVEVITGADAKAHIIEDMRKRRVATLKDVWWLFPLGVAALWWWGMG